jgi:hypothetical protein
MCDKRDEKFSIVFFGCLFIFTSQSLCSKSYENKRNSFRIVSHSELNAIGNYGNDKLWQEINDDVLNYFRVLKKTEDCKFVMVNGIMKD